MEPEIVQIVPATGWRVVYAVPGPADGAEPMHSLPLMGWALVRKDGATWLAGLKVDADAEGEVEIVDSRDDLFVGYIREGDDLETWRERARAVWTRLVAERERLGLPC